MVDKNFQAINSNSEICGMFLAILFLNKHCLINATILRREHMTFLASSSKYSSNPNKEIEKSYHPIVVDQQVDWPDTE